MSESTAAELRSIARRLCGATWYGEGDPLAAVKGALRSSAEELDRLQEALARSERHEGELEQENTRLRNEVSKLEEEIQLCPAVQYHTQ